MSDDRAEWLGALKAGDEVAIRSGWGYANYRITTVLRRDKVKIVVGSSTRASYEERFSAKSGYAPGESSRYSIVRVTPEIRESARRDELLGSIKVTNWERQTTATLEAVVAALSAVPVEEG